MSSDAILQFSDSSKYTITGEIVSFSKDYFLKKRVVLFCHLVEREGRVPVRVQGLILLNIYDKKKGNFQYGDFVQFTSAIKPIRNFSNPNGYDYEKQMKFAGISGSAYANAGKIRVIPHPMDVRIKIMRGLEQLRNRFLNFTMDKMENKQAGAILAALVTGKKEAISLKLKDLFSKAGTSHLLAISGLHLSIVAMGFYFIFYYLLTWFPLLLMTGVAKKTAGILTLIPLLFYGIFSGFSPSTQRAFIMTSIFMIAFLSERENNPLNTLALAAVVILIIDSCALFSISFQLSFGALLSIIIGFSLIRIRGWTPKAYVMGFILMPALVTFFAGVGTFPL
ncbi:MAG: DNA internalization-related competence protein ComEC/Rec2, partial [Deltaproteobacteria bacterium]